MGDIDRAILVAWERVKPVLLKDPEELARRLARRRKPLLLRPARAWCLAIRANDSRIDPFWAVMVPEDAAYPGRGDLYREHAVTIDARFVRKLCGAVELWAWENRGTKAAAKLGTTLPAMARSRKQGKFKCEYIKGYEGARCAVPFIWREGLSDPGSGNSFTPPDRIWGGSWARLAEGVDEKMEQEVKRVPVFRTGEGEKGRQGEGESAAGAAAYEGCGARRFCGWKWICPGCGKKVKTIFYPRKVPTVAEFLGDEGKMVRGEADGLPGAMECFACHGCHRIRYWSGLMHSSWNHLVAYYSGGLLYGSEVERPEWAKAVRKRKYVKHSLEMKRGMEAARMLARGMKYEEVAREMGIGLSAVQGHVRRVYKKYGIHRKRDLAKMLG